MNKALIAAKHQKSRSFVPQHVVSAEALELIRTLAMKWAGVRTLHELVQAASPVQLSRPA